MAESAILDGSSMPTTSAVTIGTDENMTPHAIGIDAVVPDGGKTNVNKEMKDTVQLKTDSGEICTPCSVVLHKLTAEEIEMYTKRSSNYRGRHREIVPTRNLRVLESVGESRAFCNFRKKRERFLNRKKLRSSETFCYIPDEEFLFSTDDDEYSDGELSEEDSQGRRKHKRRPTYENDTEWAPPRDWKGTIRSSTRLKTTNKRLKLNTRRKRLESATSSEDDGYTVKTYNTRAKPKDGMPAESVSNVASIEQNVAQNPELAMSGCAEGHPCSSNLPADNDLMQIWKEMSDFSGMTEGKDSTTADHACHAKQNSKGKTACEMQIVMSNLVNTVCSMEMRGLSANSGNAKRKCKRCSKPYSSSNSAEAMCAICKDLVLDSKALSSKSHGAETKCERCAKPCSSSNSTETMCAICKDLGLEGKKSKVAGSRPVSKVKPSKSNMIGRLLKTIPKYEQQKILYNNKSSLEKGYNHCKSLTVHTSNHCKSLSDLNSGSSELVEHQPKMVEKAKSKSGNGQTTNLGRKKKLQALKNSNSEPGKKTSKVRKLAAKVLKNNTGNSPTHVSLTSIDKGLFVMTFPESNHGIDVSKSSSEQSLQPVAKDVPNALQPFGAEKVQYGTYLLPPVPTVVVANYAATDSASGDYYLSSLYYQNESTRSKDLAVKNSNLQNGATSTITLPSMPSISQLMSESTASVLPTTYEFHTNTGAPSTDNNVNLVDVSQSSSSESSITKLFNSQQLQIEPVAFQDSEPEANVEKLLGNSELQIEPFQMSEEVSNNSSRNELSLTEETSDNVTEQDSETRLSVDDSESVNTQPTDVSKSDRDLNSVSKRNSNDVIVPKREPASDTARFVHEGMDLLKQACAELDAICIMSVVDLDENPRSTLYRYIESNKNEYEELTNSPIRDENMALKLKSVTDNRNVLSIAHKFLSAYGSFTKFSDSLLRRAKLLQIKKEAFEQETMSSCQFAKAKEPSTEEQPANLDKVPPAVRIKLENCSEDCSDAAPVNFLSKIQNQVDNMQNSGNSTAEMSSLGVIHHFPVPDLSPGTVLPTTLRSDLQNESRETPSRGSGPRTPARPESALSQPEDLQLQLQIKKENVDANNSPSSQCAYSQSSSQSTVSLPGDTYTQNAPPLTLPTQAPIVTNIAPSAPQIQNLMHFQQNSSAPPNVTVPFSAATPIQKVLFNVASPKQPQPNQNTNVIIKNGQVYNVQQVYLPRPTSLQPAQTTRTIMNQFIFKQAPVTTNSGSGGTMIVNSGMYPMQNRYTASVPTDSQPPQICSPGSFQQNMMQHVASPVNQVPPNTGFLMQQNSKVVFFEIQRSQ